MTLADLLESRKIGLMTGDESWCRGWNAAIDTLAEYLRSMDASTLSQIIGEAERALVEQLPAHERTVARPSLEAAERRLSAAESRGAAREREKWKDAIGRMLSDWNDRERYFSGRRSECIVDLVEVLEELGGANGR